MDYHKSYWALNKGPQSGDGWIGNKEPTGKNPIPTNQLNKIITYRKYVPEQIEVFSVHKDTKWCRILFVFQWWWLHRCLESLSGSGK